MSARVTCRRSSAFRLSASDCVRPSVPDFSLMSRHNYTSIRKCVFPNRGQGSAILLELLGRKLLQYFQVNKGYYLTLIQERYTACGYKFINNVIPFIPKKILQTSAEARNTHRSSKISPTRCNNCVFILRNGFTLHVSGDNLTHHQEYICCIWPHVSRLIRL